MHMHGTTGESMDKKELIRKNYFVDQSWLQAGVPAPCARSCHTLITKVREWFTKRTAPAPCLDVPATLRHG
jgi:hypothetical protein